MKRILIVFLALSLFFPFNSYGNVTFEISGGLDANPSLRAKIEYQVSALLTAINRAAGSGSVVNFSGIDIDDMASFTIAQTWNNARFRTYDDEIVTDALRLSSGGRLKGYECRNIEVEMIPVDDAYKGNKHQEVSLQFNTSGKITDFNFSMSDNQYLQIFREGERLDDLDRRLQILHFVEQFRTAYNTKDIHFLDAIFSDDALIITGKVIRRINSDVQPRPEIQYTKQSKQQYIANLRRVFARNAYLNILFDDIKIMRHGAKPNFYGVTLVQHWNSSTYSDKGILFLVWDCTDEDQPKIHVRTWQPMETPENEVFTLSDIKL
ncbi:MAG: nuclear transport factor 2 family protein [Bacteroidales bacterium]|nr:nuclear transport factor 2 family protein [Bacteroidales bacterium]MBR0301318.1 nuclear transport factor 2 family protein [Bacteroidales bacterium]